MIWTHCIIIKNELQQQIYYHNFCKS